MNIRFIPCAHCGTPRDPDLTQPCQLCGSRQYALLGYSYRHEARSMIILLAAVGIILAAAVVVGAVVFIYYNSQLHVEHLLPLTAISQSIG